jgi:HJR/Mrr/RecB family endonuclease
MHDRMPADTSREQQLLQLNHEIEQLEADAARLETERGAIAKEAGKAGRQQRYLRLAQWIRKPTASFNLWPLAVMFIGPIVVGVIALLLIHTLTGSYPAAFFAFLLGIVAGVGLFASLIYHPADTLLSSALTDAEAQSRLANARLEEKLARVTETKQKLHLLVEERRERMASGMVQRAALLQRPWKTMPAQEWEDFVVEVARTLGADAERTRGSAGDGANLIVTLGPRRTAVKTIVTNQIINSGPVNQLVNEKANLGCTGAAVITTARFTGAAQDYASRNGCTLIGRDEFPDFVLGKIEL